jgi:cytochrome c553
MNKHALLAASLLATSLVAAPVVAGDPVAGKQKATACQACHGSESFGGLFYTLQLGGRDADKLVVKTMKYKTGKSFHPMMNFATAFFSEKEIEDVAAYYKSLGKPAFTSPLFTIKGDDESRIVEAVAVPALPAAPMVQVQPYALAPTAAAVAPAAYAAPVKWSAGY